MVYIMNFKSPHYVIKNAAQSLEILRIGILEIICSIFSISGILVYVLKSC